MKKILIIIFISLCLFSCKTTTKIVEIPIETIKTEYVDKVQYDSIYLKDSILIMQKGDTIYNTKIVYQYKYKYLKDTINIKDTIQIPIKITEVKEVNKIYTHQWILIIMGFLALCYLVYKIINLIYNKYGKML